MNNICYLCGADIGINDKDDDHVPPKQFFPSRVRKTYNLSKLKTLPCHKKCNKSYEKDEVYFVKSLSMIEDRNPILNEIKRDVINTAKQRRNQRLNKLILRNITEAKSPGGIIIPGRLQLNIDENRINRVLWKIIRGLYFLNYDGFLSRDNKHNIFYIKDEATLENNKPLHEILNIVKNQEEHGEYKAIFAYKVAINTDQKIAAWAVVFWDSMLFLVTHKTP